MNWPFKRKESDVSAIDQDRPVFAKPKEQLEALSQREASRKAVELDRQHDDSLSKLRLEDEALRDAARSGEVPVSAIKHKTGVFLGLGDGKELPVAFIEGIEIIPPNAGDSKSYLINHRPHVGYGEMMVSTPEDPDGSPSRYRLFHYDRDYFFWHRSEAYAGQCYIAKAKLKVTMSSGRTDEIEINPYACEAIYAAACRVWKEGK